MISDIESFLRYFDAVHRRAVRDIDPLPPAAEGGGPADVAAGAGGLRRQVPPSRRGHAKRVADPPGAADRQRGDDKRLADPDDDAGARHPPPLADRYVRGAQRLGAAAHLRPLRRAGGAGAGPPAGAARGGGGGPLAKLPGGGGAAGGRPSGAPPSGVGLKPAPPMWETRFG